jgi:hypothetical protein
MTSKKTLASIDRGISVTKVLVRNEHEIVITINYDASSEYPSKQARLTLFRRCDHHLYQTS